MALSIKKSLSKNREMKLYNYYRSSCSYRVRIALNYKSIPFEKVEVNLLEREQTEAAYRLINPQGFVPFLQDGEVGLSQSLAIIEYLEEKFPAPALLPSSPRDRATVRGLAQIIACDTQPIQNLRVLKYIQGTLGAGEEGKLAWIQNFVGSGLEAYEAHLRLTAGKYSFGDEVSMADVCLAPQVYNARRFNVALDSYPNLSRVCSNLEELECFALAAPEQNSSSTIERR